MVRVIEGVDNSTEHPSLLGASRFANYVVIKALIVELGKERKVFWGHWTVVTSKETHIQVDKLVGDSNRHEKHERLKSHLTR